jgi:hypothetical protein
VLSDSLKCPKQFGSDIVTEFANVAVERSVERFLERGEPDKGVATMVVAGVPLFVTPALLLATSTTLSKRHAPLSQGAALGDGCFGKLRRSVGPAFMIGHGSSSCRLASRWATSGSHQAGVWNQQAAHS